MSTDRRRPRRLHRGVSLVEVMAAIAVLGVASLGLVAGMIVAINTNALAGRRTQMREFAQSRVERLLGTRPEFIPNGTSGATSYLAAMDTSPNPFDPTAAPGTGSGWVLDTLDASGGTDTMAGPLLIDSTAMSATDDHVVRAGTLNAAMLADPTLNCASPLVAQDPGVLCRDLHVEQVTQNGARLLRAWVRVVRGGAPLSDAIVIQQDIAL